MEEIKAGTHISIQQLMWCNVTFDPSQLWAWVPVPLRPHVEANSQGILTPSLGSNHIMACTSASVEVRSQTSLSLLALVQIPLLLVWGSPVSFGSNLTQIYSPMAAEFPYQRTFKST